MYQHPTPAHVWEGGFSSAPCPCRQWQVHVDVVTIGKNAVIQRTDSAVTSTAPTGACNQMRRAKRCCIIYAPAHCIQHVLIDPLVAGTQSCFDAHRSLICDLNAHLQQTNGELRVWLSRHPQPAWQNTKGRTATPETSALCTANC